MAIASWSGPIRKYKETPVTMKEKEAISTIGNYTAKFLEGNSDRNTTLTAVQLTLELCIGRHNYRRIIISALKVLESNPEDKENILLALLKSCQQEYKK